MSKQVLDLQQMQHLQELGLELKDTILYWGRCVETNQRLKCFDYGKWYLQKGNKSQIAGLSHWEFVPAYTLQDVLEEIPADIKLNDRRYWLRIDLADECIYYYYDDYDLIENRKKMFSYNCMGGLIDAAYKMLCWAIENHYVETDKNE